MLNWRASVNILLLIAVMALGTLGVAHSSEAGQSFSNPSEAVGIVAPDHASSDCSEGSPGHHGGGEVHCASAGASINADSLLPAMKRKAGERVVPVSDQIVESLFRDRLKRPPRQG